MIYVMGSEQSSVVKIGTAKDPAARLVAIQAGHPHPLTVLFQAEGGRDVERFLHRAFGSLRVSARREWFDFDHRDPVHEVQTALARRVIIELEQSKQPDWGLYAALAPSGVPS